MDMRIRRMLCVCLVAIANIGSVQAAEIVVQVQNLSPTNGFWLSPMWVGFHDESYALFEMNTRARIGGGLERLAEDANPWPLQAEFANDVPRGTSAVIEAPGGFGNLVLFGPGEKASVRLTVDPLTQRFMSYAAMVLPSNDAFIGNDDQRPIELFDERGVWLGDKAMEIGGCLIWDAGTELNTEKDAMFFNQAQPGAGIPTGHDIVKHAGLGSWRPYGITALGATNDLGIYFDPDAVDFIRDNRPVCLITVIPEPATVVLLAVGSVTLLIRRRRR